MSCDVKMIDNGISECSTEAPRVKSIQFRKSKGDKLQVSKVIYNYKQKSDQQIKDAVQLEIDSTIRNHPDYKFRDSKSHFNKTGGIEMVLNFELSK
jgi:hypothetical protein